MIFHAPLTGCQVIDAHEEHLVHVPTKHTNVNNTGVKDRASDGQAQCTFAISYFPQ